MRKCVHIFQWNKIFPFPFTEERLGGHVECDHRLVKG